MGVFERLWEDSLAYHIARQKAGGRSRSTARSIGMPGGAWNKPYFPGDDTDEPCDVPHLYQKCDNFWRDCRTGCAEIGKTVDPASFCNVDEKGCLITATCWCMEPEDKDPPEDYWPDDRW